MKKHYQQKKKVFYAISLGIVLLLFYSLFFDISELGDVVIFGLFFLGLHFFNKKHDFSLKTFYLIITAISLHLLGTLGLYSKFIILDVVGYDKLVHFTSGFALTYGLFEVITEKNKFLRFILVLFTVMGAGAVVELSEFVGQHYFGVNNGGIFTTVDNLPSIRTDLQKYDTYFDMIFNILGACAALPIIAHNKHRRIS